MRYFDLIAERPLVWGLFLAYMAFTSWLAWLGHKKTADLESFAIGKGDMHPAVVGVTLAASVASTATFVLNPGFVYVHGYSALLHLGVAAALGVVAGLFVLSFGFRRVGRQTSALTLPQWVGQRYDSRGLTVLFSAVNLLSLMFVVLIVGALSIVMQRTLGLTNLEATILIIGFVFSYIFIGGTYAHAYTNTLQGIIMVFISIMIIVSGIGLLEGGFEAVSAQLTQVDPNLAKAINPSSALFGSFFSIWICGFIIGFALVCQPHILIKALYVDEDREVLQYLGVHVFVSLFFTGLLLVGIYAHMMELPQEAFVDPETGAFQQDAVMTVYINETFGGIPLAIITVALISAGMSTLDGLLIALSSIAANDLFLNLTRDNLLAERTPEQRSRIAHHAGQVILVLMGLATFFIVYPDPPDLLAIFGQIGVYGIVAASVVPISFGIAFPRFRRAGPIFASSLAAMAVHFGLYLWALDAAESGTNLSEVVSGWGPSAALFDTSAIQLGLLNPAVSATYGIAASVLIALPCAIILRDDAPVDAPPEESPAQTADG
jgi:SSS family solute:Na+ symporter/sodium/pantothenate symporter